MLLCQESQKLTLLLGLRKIGRTKMQDLYFTLIFQKKYTWDNKEKIWKIRKQKFNIFGRVPSVPFNIKTLELFSLRLLLHHVCGAVDFADLRTINGIIFPTFQAACIELGLLEDETETK